MEWEGRFLLDGWSEAKRDSCRSVRGEERMGKFETFDVVLAAGRESSETLMIGSGMHWKI